MADKKFVTKNMMIGDIVREYPVAVEVMLKYNLHCVGCHIAASESLEQGAKGHGMDDEQIEEMVEEINQKIKNENQEDYSEFSETGEEE